MESRNNYRIFITNRIKSRSVVRDNGCIEYRGGECKHPYGLVSITIEGKRKNVPAHRAMYMALNNKLDLPPNIFIRHTCDNTCCVNIDHLEEGTAKDNMMDCIERGRRAKRYNLHTRMRIYDDDTIKAIRQAKGSNKEIAYKYNISRGYVSKIKSMKAKTLV